MTHTQYLKKMIALTDELKRTGAARPYDSNAYNKVIDQLNALHDPRGQRRRRRPSLMFYIICFLIIMFGFIVWGIIRPLYS